MKALRRKEDPAAIIQMIKSWYVSQIFKSMKLLSMNGCQERCFKFEKNKSLKVYTCFCHAHRAGVSMFPQWPHAVLLLSNNLAPIFEINPKTLVAAIFFFCGCWCWSIFWLVHQDSIFKVGIKRFDASEGEITTVKRLPAFRTLTFCQTKG